MLYVRMFETRLYTPPIERETSKIVEKALKSLLSM